MTSLHGSTKGPRPPLLIPCCPHPAPECQPVGVTFHTSQQQRQPQGSTEQKNRIALCPKWRGSQVCLYGANALSSFRERASSAWRPHCPTGCAVGVQRCKVGQRKLHPPPCSHWVNCCRQRQVLRWGDTTLISSSAFGAQSSFSAFLQIRVLSDCSTSQAFPVRASSNISALNKALW